jgi:hypothetical protein
MLKAMLENLDGLDEKEAQHYTEKDGKFFLDVTKVDGLGLENVDGLKKTVETLRTSEKNLRSEVKTAENALREHQDKFKEIDPDAARNALNKIDDIKNWDGEKKVREAVTVAEQRMQIKIDALVEQHTTEKTGLEKEIDDSQTQLQEAIVTTKIVEAIHNEEGNVNVLMPHVKLQVKMVKGSNGKYKPEVVNEAGDPRIGGKNDGADMTITELVQEMKSNSTFASCFAGANASGSGKANSSESNSTNKITDKVKTINSSDDKGMADNIEKIASGEVTVDMEN